MKTNIMLVMFVSVVVFSVGAEAQVMTPCLTMEQTNAKHNQDKANAIAVRDTSSQQLQCYYQQLATYWQQRHKDNQQIAKDIQQAAKDKQQKDKDAQQVATDAVLAERAACLNTHTTNTGYDEVVAFIEVILPYIPETCEIKTDLKKIHTNRSGHADGTNPGGQTQNIRGFDNPGYTIAK